MPSQFNLKKPLLFSRCLLFDSPVNMATASSGFKSREDHRKQKELEEARKAGLAPAEVDEDGNPINPHIPQYMSVAPWYLTQTKGLGHQKSSKKSKNNNGCYKRGEITHQAEKYRKGACENCGAISHDRKSCMERPRTKGAKLTNMYIAPDEKIEDIELDYDGKRDRWNGYDPANYVHVVKRFDALEEARKKVLKDQKLEKLEDIDEAKVDESKQVDFGKVEKRVRTTGGGSTGTVRNLRIREDTAKYLLNLDLNSAHYDPKTRSMREDPLPDSDPNEKFYGGDNQYRVSGQAMEFKQLTFHAREAYDKGQDVHAQAAPSQAELLFKNFKAIKEALNSNKRDKLNEKYGNAAAAEPIPKELLLGQTEREVEYDRVGRVINGEAIVFPRSKYEEDIYINNHTSIWGSWWKDHRWGYKCCKITIRNSYCTGAAGIEAAEAAVDLMRANIARKEASVESPVPVEEMNLATWGSDLPEGLVLDEKRLADAIKKEVVRKIEEKDERKRKYNVAWNNVVTAEDMEAYRITTVHHDDPMKDFL